MELPTDSTSSRTRNPDELPVDVEVESPAAVSWWGAIPVLALLILLAFFGGPKDRGHVHFSDRFGYIVGSFLGAVVVSYVVAYVFFRITRRSQLAGTIAFCAMIGLSCLSVASQALKSYVSRSVVTVNDVATRTDFGTFSLEVPAGWKVKDRKSPDDDVTIGLWDEQRRDWVAILQIDFGKPVIADARQLAEGMAKPDGIVQQNPIDLDDVSGVRFEIPSHDLERPRHGVVVMRDGDAYMIMVAARGDLDVSSAYEHVLTTWRWNP